MSDEKALPTFKNIDDLATGAVITMSVPCKVRVLDVKPNDGAGRRGNREVSFEVLDPVTAINTAYVGSMIELPVWSDGSGGEG